MDPVEAAGGEEGGAQGGYTLHLHRFQDVYMQGSDGLIHDVYRGTPKGENLFIGIQHSPLGRSS